MPQDSPPKTVLMTFMIVFLIVVVTLKIYLFRGINQATLSKPFALGYLMFSFATLIIGCLMFYRVMKSGMTNNTWSFNFVTALMMSVMICELFMGLFFLIDDLFLLGKWTKNFFDKSSSSSVESRRRFIKTVGLGLSALPFGAYLWGITKGKYDFRVHRQDLFFKDLPDAFDGFKVLQLSDMHSGSFDSIEEVQRGIDIVQAQNADMILFTGDLVNDNAHEIEPYIPMMKALKAPMGKYSVLGNHDYYYDRRQRSSREDKASNLELLIQHHAHMEFNLLNNENVKIEKDGQYIRLIGVENWGEKFIKKGDLDKAIVGTLDEEFSILMSHDPTHWDKKVIHHPKHIHLTLSGHTHGSQMGIETKGLRWSPVQYMYKRWAGLYQELGQYLYINRGFGFLAFAGRVGMSPEITVLTLKKEENLD